MASGCFDLLASDYDRSWTDSGAGRLQRDSVWRQIRPLFRTGDAVLDLGCGTGEDACYLAAAGVRVSAIDASGEMVRIARSRGVSAEVRSVESIQDLGGKFNGVISNFGALNCVADLPALRDPLARLIRPGGHLAICLMGRFCLSESLHFLRRGEFQKAARRWTGRAKAETLGITVYYPRACDIRHAMAPEFRLVSRTGIGLAVPQSCDAGCSPSSLRARASIDRAISGWRLLRAMADHQLFIFRRR